MMRVTVTAVAVDAINLKKLLSLILIIVVAVSLCACTDAPDTASASKPTPTATPEFLWSTVFTKFTDFDYTIKFLCFGDDEAYCCGYEKVGEEIPADVINKAKKEGKEVENDGRWDVLETRLVSVKFDGTTKVLNNFKAVPSADNINEWKNFDSTAGIGGMVYGSDDRLYIFEYVYSSGSSAPDSKEEWIEGEDYREFSNDWYIRTLSEDGSELSKAAVNLTADISLQQDSFIQYGKDFAALASCKDKSAVVTITSDGKIKDCILSSNHLDGILLMNTGKIAVFSKNSDSTEIYSIDIENEEFLRHSTINVNVDKLYSGSGTAEYYYTSGLNLYSYYDGASHEEYNFSAVNIDVSDIASSIHAKDNNVFTFLTKSGSVAQTSRMYYVEEAERKALKLAAYNPSNELISAVSEFNKSNYDVRIDIEDYSKYADGKTGLSALYDYCNNHLGGNFPDIIELSSLPYSTMIQKNILEDLYPYIDADESLNRDDYFANALKACEVDDKLFCTCSGFCINTVIGLKETVGDSIGWTYDDYYRTLSSMPSGSTGFEYYTSQNVVLEKLMELEMDQFVNFKEKTCSFDDGRFEKLLNFVKSFPEYYDYSSVSSNQQSRDLIIRDGKQMLLDLTVYGFSDFMMAGYEFDGDITFVGYPTLSGTGNSITPKTFNDNGNLAMTTTCSDKTTAWNFLRNFFSENYQEKCSFFPSNKNVFERKLTENMITTPVLSKDGEQLYDDEGQPRINSVGTMYLSDFTPVPYYPITESQANSLNNLISTTSKIKNSNADILRIVKSNYRQENACEIIQDAIYSYLNA